MTEDKHERLSDHILTALKVSTEQKDMEISKILLNALELSMTRKAGGGEFIERRQYPEEIEAIIQDIDFS